MQAGHVTTVLYFIEYYLEVDNGHQTSQLGSKSEVSTSRGTHI